MAKQRLKSEQLEAALLEHLDRLERRIEKLKREQDGVRAALASHRASHLRYKGAIRKNSFSKLLTERRIIDVLKKRSGKPTPIAMLYEMAGTVDGVIMPESTFRSHLHRMKKDGLIVTHMRGSYRLPNVFD